MRDLACSIIQSGTNGAKILILGPIVRANHSEFHINDPEYYEKLYNFSSHFGKKEFRIDVLHRSHQWSLIDAPVLHAENF